MRLFLFFALLALPLISCVSTDSRRAGGGAFDDSELGRQLDANIPLQDRNDPSSRSFEEWRERD